MPVNLLIGIFFVCTFSLRLWAGIEKAPSSISFGSGQAVFVDFKTADYRIVYNANEKTARSFSRIVFEAKKEGFPIFDLVENPTQVKLDGELVDNQLIQSKDKETTVRIALAQIKAGEHLLEIEAPLLKGTKFIEGGVSSAFWFSDLDERSYLEAYLPSNLEYDQYKMSFVVEFIGSKNQKIYTNGKMTARGSSIFSIEFPDFFTSSSLYFHTAPVGYYPEVTFDYDSVKGQKVAVSAYTFNGADSLKELKLTIVKSLQELEVKYGPFLYTTLVVFDGDLMGGMEYCGAATADLRNLKHELTHSYFGRGGFMPANGNAGWIDEAIVTWIDEGEISRAMPPPPVNLAGHSEYRRFTPMEAYSSGGYLMGYLHYKFKVQGGLQTFLKHIVEKEAFKPMTTENFIEKMSQFYGEDMSAFFKKYAYKNQSQNRPEPSLGPSHNKLSIQQMSRFL